MRPGFIAACPHPVCDLRAVHRRASGAVLVNTLTLWALAQVIGYFVSTDSVAAAVSGSASGSALRSDKAIRLRLSELHGLVR
jgi:hypothetical protein